MGRVLAAAAIGLILAGPAHASGGKPLGPPAQRLVEPSFDKGRRVWTIKVWSGPAGEVATGKVDDTSGAVLEAWTGPQVAWKMARGGKGAFGGRQINSYKVWLGLCV